MSISLSILETTEKNIEYEKEVEEIKLKMDNLSREKELLSNELKYKEKEYEKKIEELNINNLVLKKTVENLEELTNKLKEFQSFPENSKEKVLEEIQQKCIDLENKLILTQNSENRIKLEYEHLLISHSQLQKEIQKVNFRKKSANDHNLFVDEDEELENVESLREIIIELSNEYEDLKVKYQKLLDLYYEKEKTLMEIKEKHNIKEDELLNKILQYEAQIRTLNEKIIDKDYQELNEPCNDYTRRKGSNVIKYKGSFSKRNCSNLEENSRYDQVKEKGEDDIDDNLLEEIEKKDKMIEEMREDYTLNIKSIEERYINHISQLEKELQKYQDSLSNGNEYKSILQGEISQIDETNQEMKLEIQNLRTKLREADIIKKNVEFNHKNQIEKLDQEIKEYVLIIENHNKNKKVMEKNYKIIYQRNENILREIEEINEKYSEKEKELKLKTKVCEELKRDLDAVIEEKEAVKKEFKIFKEDFMNFREKYKENVDKQMGDMEFENKKLKKLIERHKFSNRASMILSHSNNSIELFKDSIGRKKKDNYSYSKEDFKKTRCDPSQAIESFKKLIPIKRAETICNFKESTLEKEDKNIDNSPLLRKLNTNYATLNDILLDELDQPCFMKKILSKEECKRSSEIFNIVEEMVNNQDARMPVQRFGSFFDPVPEENPLEIDQSNTTTKTDTMKANEFTKEDNRRSDLKEEVEFDYNENFELKNRIIDLEATISILKDDKEKLQTIVKELEETIDSNEKKYEISINDIKKSNLLNNMSRRSLLIADKNFGSCLNETHLYSENKIKSLDAEIEFYKNKIKISENEFSSKNLVLENEVKYLRGEIEKSVFETINLKVQLANVIFEKEQEQLKYSSNLNKLKTHIKNKNEVIRKNLKR